MKTAILGFGVVGSGAFEVLEKAGYEVKRVLDIRPHDELGDKLTANYDDILNDKEISVVAEAIGGRVHIAHISTRGTVELVRQAKKRGVKVTCETCPHYFSLTEEACIGYNTNAKMNPPLREEGPRGLFLPQSHRRSVPPLRLCPAVF